MKSLRRYAVIISIAILSSTAFAQSEPQKPYEERKADLKKACDACGKGVKKDPGEWDISAALGFNITQGNADTTLINAQTVAHREMDQDIYNVDLNGAFGKQEDVETQRYFKADAAYKRILDEKLFAATSLGYFTDDIARIDYRTIINPGIGYFLLKDDTTTLSFEAGPSYIFQKLSGVKENFLAGRIANGFEWKLSETSKIFETTEYILDVEDTSQSIINATAGIEAALTSKLALVWTIRDRYNSQPALDAEKNDVIITCALKVSL